MRVAVAVAVLMLFAVGAQAAPAMDLIPCQRLAGIAKSLPLKAWTSADRLENALRPALEIDSVKPDTSSLARKLLNTPWVRHALDDKFGNDLLHQGHSDLYAAENVAGTAICQSLVFLRTGPNAEARQIASPPYASHTLCMTRSGAFGRVFGQPAFIESGLLASTSDEDDIQITPWTGTGWGPACRLELRFEPVFVLKGRHCADDRSICDAATEVALPLAAAFHQKLQTSSAAAFRFGPPAPTAAVQRVAALKPDDRSGRPTPAFPTFNGPIPELYPDYSSDFELVPLMLNGKAYAAGVAYGGIGWREIGDILFGVYDLEGGALKPMAGFSVAPGIKRLASAKAVAPSVDPS